MEPKYWAGGWWGLGNEQPSRDDLIDYGFWKIGWSANDPNPQAKASWTRLKNISVGDMIALKGMSGSNKIRIYAIGEISGISRLESEQVLDVKWNPNIEEFIIDRPKDEGAGNWGATFLQITREDVIDLVFKTQIVSFAYVNSLQIQNYKKIREITLSNLGDKKEIYFLGENGDGKTSLLQGILLALRYYTFGSFEQSQIGRVLQTLKENQEFNFSFNLKHSKGLIEFNKAKAGSSEQIQKTVMPNIFSYGVQRGKRSIDASEEYGFITLFNSNYELSLKDPISWIAELDRLELAKKQIPIKTEEVFNILKILFQNEDESEYPQSLDIKFSDDNARKVTFIFNGEDVEYENLSEGYKSVMTWVCDLISRLVENQPNTERNNKNQFLYKGIVLIDEVDIHLHPKWAYTIVRKLRNWFPNIQFFITTHSPIVILGASEDAVVYKLYKNDSGEVRISEGINDLSRYAYNSLITSPFFDLELMTSNSFDMKKSENLSINDFKTKVLREALSKKIKENPGVLNSDEIQKWADEELSKMGNII